MTKRPSPSAIRLTGQPDLTNIALLDHGILPLLMRMMSNGIRIDRGRFATLSERLSWDLLTLEARARDAVSRDDFAISSPDQIECLLFDPVPSGGLDLDPGPIRTTPTGKRYEVDDAALAYLEPQHPVVPHIRAWRKVEKLRNTYTTTLPLLADSRGRIHTRLNNTLTVTGRLSSSSPNLQNIPKRSELGLEVRRCFIPSAGNVFGSIDLSQIEIVVAAHYSGSVRLLEALNSGGDIHTVTAAEFFNWPNGPVPKSRMTEAQKTERDHAKIGNFLAIYEGTPSGLSSRMIALGCDQDEWTPDRCDEFLDVFYDLYPELATYQAEQHRRARRYGFVWTLYGRVRFIPEVKSKLRKIREEGFRYASNMPIQGTAGDILKLAMQPDTLALCDELDVMPLLQVHDELLFEGKREDLEALLPEMAERISASVQLAAPVKASWGISAKSWGDLER